MPAFPLIFAIGFGGAVAPEDPAVFLAEGSLHGPTNQISLRKCKNKRKSCLPFTGALPQTPPGGDPPDPPASVCSLKGGLAPHFASSIFLKIYGCTPWVDRLRTGPGGVNSRCGLCSITCAARTPVNFVTFVSPVGP